IIFKSMRKVLSISVTSVLERDIKQKTKKRGFNSVSDYIKNLVVADEDLISEEELLEEIRRGEEEYEKGDVVRGKRLSDFI
ncbi:MAG: hypothetical protein WA091_01230, partial [Minisyncoccales bacterium]